jgi:hypothetical protein
MRDIPDNAPLTALRIPETPDPCYVDDPLGSCPTNWTQGYVFSIRLSHIRKPLSCTMMSHGKVALMFSEFFVAPPFRNNPNVSEDAERSGNALDNMHIQSLGTLGRNRVNWVVWASSLKMQFSEDGAAYRGCVPIP